MKLITNTQVTVDGVMQGNYVYRYAVNPLHLPEWAAGLSGAIARVGGDWISESPMGKVKFRFVKKNDLGVLDHFVTLPSGVTIYHPMRVFPNHDGSEVVFTLFRQPGTTSQAYAKDARAIEADLRKLKSVLEDGTCK